MRIRGDEGSAVRWSGKPGHEAGVPKIVNDVQNMLKFNSTCKTKVGIEAIKEQHTTSELT